MLCVGSTRQTLRVYPTVAAQSIVTRYEFGRHFMNRRIAFLVLLIVMLLACGPVAAATVAPPTLLAPTAAVILTEPPASPAPTETFAPEPTETLPPAPTATEIAFPTVTLAPAVSPVAEIPFGQQAYDYLVSLTALGQRIAGSETESQAVDLLAEIFSEMGYSPVEQPFTFDDGSRTAHSANIIAVKPGDSAREIIIGAHYDSVDIGVGADDNASGVSVMLEVASRVKDIETPYTLRFIAFGAEEVDLDGSAYYVSQMSAAEIANTEVMVNLDSLIAGDITYVYGDAGRAGIIRDWVLDYARQEGLDLVTSPDSGPGYPAGTTCDDCSDHAAFMEAGIQYAYFEATNWNLGDEDGYTQVDLQYGDDGYIWHTRYDNLEYLEETFPGRVEAHLSLFATLLYAIVTQYYCPFADILIDIVNFYTATYSGNRDERPTYGSKCFALTEQFTTKNEFSACSIALKTKMKVKSGFLGHNSRKSL